MIKFVANDRIEYAEKEPGGDETIFLLGPCEGLVEACARFLKATPEWNAIFGTSIDTYKRVDYSIRELPALRLYNEQQLKEFDSWFITGDIIMDIIWPASLRREDLQRFPDTVGDALLQQFRRAQSFFDKVSELVPGLNELGKTFSVDKSLGFEWEDDILPLTQIRANFRIDLRIWDDQYMNQAGRTKDDPFNVTVADLTRVVTEIRALNDDGTKELSVQNDQLLTP